MQTDKYKKYTATDFLKDKDFIRWRLFNDEKETVFYKDILERYPELKLPIEEAIELYNESIRFNDFRMSDSEISASVASLHKQIRTLKRKRNQKRIVLSISAVAASVAVVLISTLFYFQFNGFRKGSQIAESYIVGNELESEDIQLITGNETVSFQDNIDISVTGEGKAQVKKEKETQAHKDIEMDRNALNRLVVPYGKRTTLTLADGSKVWLNSGSVLEFPAQFSEKDREIYLASGEMYIEVSPDRKKTFYVHTTDFKVRVTGTKFNLSAYADSPRSVVLVEGSVSLQADNLREQQLQPNEQAVLANNGVFVTQRVDVDHFVSWKNGYLTLDKTPITEVLNQIGRYYNLSFDFSHDADLQKRTCTGKIYLSDNLDNVMTTVGLLTSTEYKREENNKISIMNKSN